MNDFVKNDARFSAPLAAPEHRAQQANDRQRAIAFARSALLCEQNTELANLCRQFLRALGLWEMG